MARKSHEDALGVTGAETIIGTGVVVKGNLASESDIIIDGTLTGHLKAGGNVTLGVNASVKGDVTAVNITVAGNLTGNIAAEGETTIRETGQVQGDITTTSLAVSPGAIFIGRSLMQAPPRLAQEPPKELDGPANPEN
jgi:cytoskeletal protein CcmA (bactofilin family)